MKYVTLTVNNQYLSVDLNEDIREKISTKRSGLAASIEKWETMVKLLEMKLMVEENGDSSCGLCHLYFEGDCIGCPVMEKTGKDRCDDTPYRDFIHARDHQNIPCMLSAAKKELKFLKSLK